MVCRRGGGTLVAGRHSSDSGSAQGGEFQVNSYTTGNQRYSAVASDAIGNFVVVWVREGQYSSYGIFGQRYGDLIFGDGFQ